MAIRLLYRLLIPLAEAAALGSVWGWVAGRGAMVETDGRGEASGRSGDDDVLSWSNQPNRRPAQA